MRVGSLKSFVVSARAVEQGTMWVGVYRINRYDESFITSSAFIDDTFTDKTFATRREAENAAFAEGEDWVRRAQTRSTI